MSQEKTIEFDYKGLDELIKQNETFLDNVKLIEDKLRSIYLERLQTFNRDSLEQNPEPFRFLAKSNCSLIIFITPYQFNYSQAAQIFILSTPHNREVNVNILSRNDLSDLDTYINYQEFFNEKILPLYGYDKSKTIINFSDFYPNLSNKLSIFSDTFNLDNHLDAHSLRRSVIDLIRKEIISFQEINKTKLSYFAKDAFKFPFSLFDLKPLIELVNDDDFSYQLDQAMAAYHENLFLPCAATLGVVLETLCIKILEHNGITKIKSGDTQLGKLKEKLINERIITRRDNTRLEVAYKMRNMASHSSPGIALKEDCHFMLNVINTIAYEYLGNN